MLGGIGKAYLWWTALVYEYPNFGILSKHMGGVRSKGGVACGF